MVDSYDYLILSLIAIYRTVLSNEMKEIIPTCEIIELSKENYQEQERILMNILETVLVKMSNINKAQRNFMVALLMNLMRLRGKANYRNLSRYSDYHEKSYSCWFKRDFDFIEFNRLNVN